MIHPNRTYLLQLKEKKQSATGSLGILKARRQALIMELLNSSRPFLKSRQGIKQKYKKAITEIHFSLGHEGEKFIQSIAAVDQRDIRIDIEEKNVLGVKYREVRAPEQVVRSPDARHYDYVTTTPHLEESCHLFEEIVHAMLQIATYENKIKRLGEEIVQVSRKVRVLEERVMPQIDFQIKTISMYISERDRENYFRLKKFKTRKQGNAKARLDA